MQSSQKLSFEDVRATLWFWPSVAAALALAVAVVLAQAAPAQELLSRLPWPSDVTTASTVLQVVATAVMTATSLTFSLVVVALQLFSQQFSPRLLREFARDWVIQSVLAVLVSAFVFSLTVLLALDSEREVPRLAVLVAYLLGLLSVAALLTFLGHMVRRLRIDTMMVAVHDETVASIESSYPSYEDPEPRRPDDLPDPTGGTVLCARRSGFVKVIEPAPLVAAADRLDLVLWMLLRPGDHMVTGTPIGLVLRPDGSPAPADLVDQLHEDVQEAVEVGYERTAEQDVALGLRQLEDIAVKALSPSVNDPVTAAHAVGYCTDLLVRVHQRRLGPQVHEDRSGQARVVLPDRDHRYYLDLVCSQLRRYSRSEPSVLVALLRMLRDVAVTARPEHHDELRRQAAQVAAEMADDLQEADTASVHRLVEQVELALAGRLAEAYDDRAGETRSM